MNMLGKKEEDVAHTTRGVNTIVIIFMTMIPASLKSVTMSPIRDRRKIISVSTMKHTTCRDTILLCGER